MFTIRILTLIMFVQLVYAQQKSLADIARENRAKQKATPSKVYTNDTVGDPVDQVDMTSPTAVAATELLGFKAPAKSAVVQPKAKKEEKPEADKHFEEAQKRNREQSRFTKNVGKGGVHSSLSD